MRLWLAESRTWRKQLCNESASNRAYCDGSRFDEYKPILAGRACGYAASAAVRGHCRQQKNAPSNRATGPAAGRTHRVWRRDLYESAKAARFIMDCNQNLIR